MSFFPNNCGNVAIPSRKKVYSKGFPVQQIVNNKLPVKSSRLYPRMTMTVNIPGHRYVFSSPDLRTSFSVNANQIDLSDVLVL